MQRSLLLFENSLKTNATRSTYLWNLNKFKNYYKLKDYDSMVSIPIPQLQIMIEDYVMMLKKRISPNSIITYMSGIEAFFETNDVDLKWKKIKRLYPALVKKTGGHMWTTEDIRVMLESTRDLRQKALIHFLASSGVRRGAIPELKIKHLTQMPNGCKAVTAYEGTLEEYVTFIHAEASYWLERYLQERKNDGEYIDENSPVFRKSYQIGIQKVFPMSDGLILKVIGYVIKKSGLRAGQTKSSGRYNIQTEHGFRKRWNTIVENTDGMKIILAEKMMGHFVKSIPLAQVYNLPTIDILFKEYQKAIPELTITNIARKEAELNIVKQEKSELEKKVNEIENMKEEIRRIKLRNELSDILKQKMVAWVEKNPGKITSSQAAKSSVTSSNKFEELVEHYLKEHQGDISDLKQRITNALIEIRTN